VQLLVCKPYFFSVGVQLFNMQHPSQSMNGLTMLFLQFMVLEHGWSPYRGSVGLPQKLVILLVLSTTAGIVLITSNMMLVGAAFILLVSSAVLLGFVVTWSKGRFVDTRFCWYMSLFLFGAFELFCGVAPPPFQFKNLSWVLVSFNAIPVIVVIYINGPFRLVCFSSMPLLLRFVWCPVFFFKLLMIFSWFEPSPFVPNAGSCASLVEPSSHLQWRRSTSCNLYILSLLVLLVFAGVTQMSTQDQEHHASGWAVVTMIVL
jgi:hypothetical protein